ncbi:single-stranded DNA-binding protein [Chitinophaga agrisoli]|uniref:Single-stranded DNA-binding protein n=1 Tax=Chitinophaga agrisoli TaxID=2607653 RepID=A0A5B2VPK1_9BACT|nr:single-stranded DNA-binding protein [Chitinophaga agrisoli]KAA2240137.1 single-stranded DNA-binding protein [Chitinophaga agrisoli]
MIKLQLIGYLGKDAVQREANGKSVLGFSVAHTERFRNQQGISQEKTTWVDCSLWERENLTPYLTQGTQVYVEGTPVPDVYSNNVGISVPQLRLRVYNIQLLSGGRRDEMRRQPADETDATGTDPMREPEDELPF